MLHLTSCLFATIVVHAYYQRATVYHHAFLLLTVSSILFHLTHGDAIRILDKALAHATFVMVLLDTPKAIAAGEPWLLCFPLSASVAWFAQSALPLMRDDLHLCLHLIALAGMHTYLQRLY
jgi:hypothetical protein